jgi:hypothetical protein
MTGWKSIFLAARRSLVALGVLALLCKAGLVALYALADSLATQVAQLGSAVQDQRGQLAQKQENLRNVRSHIERYERLRSQGLVGAPDRAQWVEELLASHARLGLTLPLIYQLQVPKTVVEANAAATAATAAVSIDGTSEEPLAHDLQFELRDVHEGDVMRLIQDFRSHVKGRFRVNSCTFAEPRVSGMRAQCVLRFVTVPLPKQLDSAAPVR